MNETRRVSAQILTHPLWDIIGLITAFVALFKLLHPDVKYP